MQVKRSGPNQAAQERDDLGTHTYVFSTTSGEGLYVGTDLPRVYRASGDRLYAAGNAEYPQLQVMAY